MNNGKRCRFTITAAILEACRNGANKNNIAHRALVDYNILNKHLAQAVQAGLIAEHRIHGRRIYHTTSKGYQYLEAYHNLLELLKA